MNPTKCKEYLGILFGQESAVVKEFNPENPDYKKVLGHLSQMYMSPPILQPNQIQGYMVVTLQVMMFVIQSIKDQELKEIRQQQTSNKEQLDKIEFMIRKMYSKQFAIPSD